MTEAKSNQDTGLNPVAIIEAVAADDWKSKLRKVAVQLGIGTQKGARLYAAGRDQIDTSEGKSIVAKALAEAVAKEAIDNPVMMERARARFLSEFGAKQENLEAVMVGAADHLSTGPSPEPLPLTSGRHNNAGNAEDQESTDDAAPLDSDWAASFTREAEGATSEELRDRLARVLAGEIRAPGTYPRGVLRSIAELDKTDIEAMNASMPYRIGNAIFHVATEEGERLTRLLRLADAGLVADATSGLARIFDFAPEGDRFVAATFGRIYGIVIFKSTGGRSTRDFAPLNRAGQSVADLLDADGEQEKRALIALASTFEAEAQEITLGRIVYRSGDKVQLVTVDWLKSAPKVSVTTPVAAYSPLASGDPFEPKFQQS
jgi:hypothetical protein